MTKVIQFRVADSEYDQIRDFCESKKLNLSAILKEFIIDYIKDYSSPAPKKNKREHIETTTISEIETSPSPVKLIEYKVPTATESPAPGRKVFVPIDSAEENRRTLSRKAQSRP